MSGDEEDRGGYSRAKEQQTEDGCELVVTVDKGDRNQRVVISGPPPPEFTKRWTVLPVTSAAKA